MAGILPADEGPRPHLPIFEDAADVLTDRPGLWFPEVPVGTFVARGTRLGRLEDAFGTAVQEILAPAAGVLSYGRSSLAPPDGDLLPSLPRAGPGTAAAVA